MSRWRNAVVAIRRAGRRRLRTPPAGRWLTLVSCMLAGLMITTGALASRGVDLRPDRNLDLIDLVRAEAARNAALTEGVARLRDEVDAVAGAVSTDAPLADQIAEAALRAGTTEVRGPAVSVSLTDAPLDVRPAGVDEDLLIVHQQDIQAVANALWAGGAEAMTIQGQRVTALTGIKCVGNTVVLHGVPYAPPYVITAIGEPAALEAALDTSPYLQIYEQYVDAYGLGYSRSRLDDVLLPAYRGSLDMANAQPIR